MISQHFGLDYPSFPAILSQYQGGGGVVQKCTLRASKTRHPGADIGQLNSSLNQTSLDSSQTTWQINAFGVNFKAQSTEPLPKVA